MIQLRPYQKDLVNSVLQSISNPNNKNILAVASTGSGKTVCFIEITKDLVKKMKNDECVLILSHLSLLTSQTKERFEQFTDLSIGVLQGQRAPMGHEQVIISTMQTSRDEEKMLNFVKRSRKKPRYIIVDESHRRFSNSYSIIFQMFPKAQVIDFTATPYKNKRLATGFYDDVPFQISMQELIDKGYLIRPILKQVTFDGDDITKRCSLVLNLYKKSEMGKSAIVFLKTKKECEVMQDVFLDSNIKAYAVTSDTNEYHRKKIFDEFNSGKAKVLISVNVLTAGFDAPRCSSVFMFKTDSVIQYIQRIGRALRPFENQQHANIYYVGKTPELETGDIEKIHKQVIRPKKKEECSTITELIEWQEGNEVTDNHEYKEAKEVYRVIKLASKMKMLNISRFLDTKEISSKLTGPLESSIKRTRGMKPNTPITPKQKNVLNKYLSPKVFHNLDRREASALIHSISGKFINPSGSDKFVLSTGRHAGKHIKDVPWAYKTLVLKKFPDSDVAKTIRLWHK